MEVPEWDAQAHGIVELGSGAEELEEEREVTARDFSGYGRPLEMVTYFKYLGG